MPKLLLVLTLLIISSESLGDGFIFQNTKIKEVAVAGNSRSFPVNYTSCLKIAESNEEYCKNGWIAILDNNSNHLDAALAAQINNKNVDISYANHEPYVCANNIRTNCWLDYIIIK